MNYRGVRKLKRRRVVMPYKIRELSELESVIETLIIEDAESKARQIIDDMEDEIRQLEQVFRSLDANKTALMSDLKVLAEDIFTKIGRHEEFPTDIKQHVKKSKELSREVNDKSAEALSVEQILADNEQKQAEDSITEMVDQQEGSDDMPSIEEMDADGPKDVSEEEVKADSEKDSKKMKTDESTEELTEEEKEKGSFFDQFD